MEVLAAIGLAGSIVQFVDNRIRWTSTVTELHGSLTGSLEKNIEAERAVKGQWNTFEPWPAESSLELPLRETKRCKILCLCARNWRTI